MKQGIIFALICYGLWGVLPIYWKSLGIVPSDQILAHRMVWSLAFVAIFIFVKHGFSWLKDLIKNPKNILYLFLASVVISINWFIYISAVNAGHIIETSLGYFINPLMTFSLGVFVFKERPRRLQWAAILTAATGVVYLTWSYGHIPWIALSLAAAFAIYGVIKKIIQISPMKGMFVETTILFIPAAMFLSYKELQGEGAFGHISLTTDITLVFAGLVTLLPLYFFAAAAQKIPFSALGVFQYLAPSLQFVIGVFVYKEQFNLNELFGYSMIWFALIIFSGEGYYVGRLNKAKKQLII